MTNEVSRREFLKVVGTGVVGLAAGTAIGYNLASIGGATAVELEPREVGITATPVSSRGEKITIWVSNPVHLKYWEPRLEKFRAERPDFGHEIEALHVSGGIYEKLMAALLAGKGAPDTVNVASNWMSGIFKGGDAGDVLYDIVPNLLEDYPNYNTEFLKWSPYTDLDGKIYGVELGLCPTIYYYRKDLHDEAGIDPATYVTYEDFIEGGKAFNEAHPGKFSMVADVSGMDTFGILMMQNGGGYFDKAGDVIVDCDENIEALQLLYDMAVIDEMAWPSPNVWGPGMWAALEDGTAAGNIGADWYSTAVLQVHVPDQAGKWAAAPMPVFKPGGAVSMQHGGGAYCITKQSKSPVATWELLKYVLMSGEGQISKYEQAGFFPNRLDVMNDSRIVDAGDPFFGGQKIGALLAEVAPSTVSALAHPFLPEAMEVVRKVVPVVIAGEKTPQAALRDAAQETKDLIARG